MKIGALVFLTEQSGNARAQSRAKAETQLGFESFFVAEHMVVPSTYTTHYPRSRERKKCRSSMRKSLIDPVRRAPPIRGGCDLAHQNRHCDLSAGAADVIETAKVTASIDLYSKEPADSRRRRGMVPRRSGSHGRPISRGAGSICANPSKALRTLWSGDDGQLCGRRS